MTATFVVVVYLCIGASFALFVLVREQKIGSLGPPVVAILMIPLWPFLFPGTALVDPGSALVVGTSGTKTARAQQIDGLVRRLEQIWTSPAPGGIGARDEARERLVLETFVARLRASEIRLGEMAAALEDAPTGVRDKLNAIHDLTAKEIDQGRALLEELVGQLLVLRFSDLARPDAAQRERENVEGLLVKIETLASLSTQAR